ncbi:MAG: hypothetical protein IKV89_00365 [Clostridia bacterium]|nr:hypothetical protein [Clostridia bacterium]
MPEYIISVICIIIFALAFYLILRAVTPSSNMKIEIIIDARQGEEETEKTIVAAKLIADRHFKNAEIYIRGGNPDYVETLCRQYGIVEYNR